jgi:hypothetical protein
VAEYIDDPKLSETLKEPTGVSAFPFLDLSTLDAEQFNKILDAAQRAFNYLLYTGAEMEFTPLGYFNYMYRFSQLKALLLLDSRAVLEEKSTTIVIRENVQWQTEAWAGDLVLEAIATHPSIQLDHPELVEKIITARGNEGTGLLDLQFTAEDTFCHIREPIEWAYRLYGMGQRRMSNAEGFYTALAPQVIQLHTLIMTDKRAENCGPLPGYFK